MKKDKASADEWGGTPIPPRSFAFRPDDGATHLLTALDGWPAAAVHGVAAALLAAMGALDYVTGTELSFSVFYLVPVSLAAWCLGRGQALVWAVAAAAVWLAVELTTTRYSNAAIPYWNAGVRLAFFAIVAAALATIRRLLQAEHTLAGTDLLTGLLNRRAFYELVEAERGRALRYNRPFTLACMDIDGFKRINDDFGHARGDQTLRLVAQALRGSLRSIDSVSRLGGDEFALLMPETGTGAAEVALRKVQQRLVEVVAAEALPISFSIGAVICVRPPETMERLLQRADALMYRAKRGGRNGLLTAVADGDAGIGPIPPRG